MKFLFVSALAACVVAQDPSKCNKWCQNTNFPDQCINQAKSSLGPCFDCGPANVPSYGYNKLCDGVCKDTSQDTRNCGTCEHLCDSGVSCNAGKCLGKTNCPKMTVPARTYALQNHTGTECRYSYRFPIDTNYLTTKVADNAIQSCQTFCGSNIKCRMFTLTDQGDGSFRCNTWATPYYAASVTCGTTPGISGGFYIYSVTNWIPPANGAINGDFETGCGDPWTWSYGYVSGYVKKCDKTKAGDCINGNYHFQSLGNSSLVDPELTYDLTLKTIPVVDEQVTYNVSVYLRGTTGSFVIRYPVFRTLHPILFQGQATGNWEKISFTITTYAGLTMELNFNAPGVIDWAVDALSITKA